MNKIHSTAIIGQNAIIGDNNEIGPYCFLDNCVIGDNNIFSSHVIIGQAPEHRRAQGTYSVEIGNFNTFREFITVHCGTTRATEIGSRNYFMTGSHVAHDCLIFSDVTMTNGARLAGHVIVMDGANLGLNSCVHQHQIIGAYAMLGMGTVVTKGVSICPGEIWVGNPAEFLKKNEIGLDRASITDDDLLNFEKQFEKLKCSQF